MPLGGVLVQSGLGRRYLRAPGDGLFPETGHDGVFGPVQGPVAPRLGGAEQLGLALAGDAQGVVIELAA